MFDRALVMSLLVEMATYAYEADNWVEYST